MFDFLYIITRFQMINGWDGEREIYSAKERKGANSKRPGNHNKFASFAARFALFILVLLIYLLFWKVCKLNAIRVYTHNVFVLVPSGLSLLLLLFRYFLSVRRTWNRRKTSENSRIFWHIEINKSIVFCSTEENKREPKQITTNF